MNYDAQTIEKLQPTPAQDYSAEAVELMGAMKLREQKTGAPIKQPSEIFACLLAMGYQRQGETMDVQQRAQQFVAKVRDLLVTANRRSPYYDEVLRTMGQLGYTRSLSAVGKEDRSAAIARNQWKDAN